MAEGDTCNASSGFQSLGEILRGKGTMPLDAFLQRAQAPDTRELALDPDGSIAMRWQLYETAKRAIPEAYPEGTTASEYDFVIREIIDYLNI
ncbi:hypothetical protein HZA99_00095 [Candidatus Woesearchaeota archaeon]|nr:hypothetical protein [Candidatus Woesearchaeota archaeon]